MIFGSVINEDLKDEIVVTVIATGFNEEAPPIKQQRQGFGQVKPSNNPPLKREPKREEIQQEPVRNTTQHVEDTLDIPTFLRNRNRR